MLTLDRFKAQLLALPDAVSYSVAYSGGVDSHVLLHLMMQLYPEQTQAIHIHHGLSPNADAWRLHCQRVCDALRVPLLSQQIQVKPKPRHSLEALARDARYAAMRGLLPAGGALLTGHHQDDQAETVLLQLMRGAGVRGLSGMPKHKSLGQGQLYRPLLSFSRAEIKAYATEAGLEWVDDESNQSTQFDRNFLRQVVMPALTSRRAGVMANMARSAAHLAEASALVNTLAEIDFEAIKTADLNCVLRLPLQRFSEARLRNVLRYWLTSVLSVMSPSEAILAQIIQQLVLGQPDSQPIVRWGDVSLSWGGGRQIIVLDHF